MTDRSRRATSRCAGTSRTATSTTSPPPRGTGNPGTSSSSGSGGNVNVFNVVLGGVAVAIGLTFWWALIAITIGTLIGALLIALHATQGPRLGVPQSDPEPRPVRLLRGRVHVPRRPAPERRVHRGRAGHPGPGHDRA